MIEKKWESLSGLERIIALLKDPEFKELLDNLDTIIFFEEGKFVGNITGEELR